MAIDGVLSGYGDELDDGGELDADSRRSRADQESYLEAKHYKVCQDRGQVSKAQILSCLEERH